MCFSVWGRWCRYFFPRWYPNCVKFDPAVLSFFKKSWVAELRIGWVVDYAKEVKIFVLFHWRYKKHTKMRNPEELSLTRRRTLERKEPLRRGTSYVWPALSRHFRRNSWLQLPFLMLLRIFLRLLDLQLCEFLHVEPQRAHGHWPFPQSHLQTHQGWEDVDAAERTASANTGQNAILHFLL